MLLPGPLKNILRGSRVASPGAEPALPAARPYLPSRVPGTEEASATRPSRGLEEFFRYIHGQTGLNILDLGGATQQNVSFITNLGHRLYSEDFLQILNETFGLEDTVDQSNPGQIEYFL